MRRRFRDYVLGMGDGRVDVSQGADELPDGRLRFPAEGTALRNDVAAFRGRVQYSGHLGLLSVRISNPRVERRRGSLVLTIDDDVDEEVVPRLDFASIGEPRAVPGGVEYGSVLLTEVGADLFLGVYPAGTPLDAVTVGHVRS